MRKQAKAAKITLIQIAIQTLASVVIVFFEAVLLLNRCIVSYSNLHTALWSIVYS